MTSEQPPQPGADPTAAQAAPGRAADRGTGSSVEPGPAAAAPGPATPASEPPGTSAAAASGPVAPSSKPAAPPGPVAAAKEPAETSTAAPPGPVVPAKEPAGTAAAALPGPVDPATEPAGPSGKGDGGQASKPVRRWAGLRRGRAAKTADTPATLRSAVPAQPPPGSAPSTKDRPSGAGATDTDAAFPANGSTEELPTSTPGPAKGKTEPVGTPKTSPPTSGTGSLASKTGNPGPQPGNAPDPQTGNPGPQPGNALDPQTSEPASKTDKADPPAGKPAAEPGNADPKADPLAKDRPSTEQNGEATPGKNSRRRKPKLPSTRPPGAPPDPWTAFAETSDRAPGRIRRAGRAVGRALIHEYALVVYGSLLLAVVLTWPTLRYPLHTFPQDIWDPSRQAWQISWAGHILSTDPARLWQSNAFFPEPYSFAFGDSLLGYAPAGLLGSGPLAAVLRYNILFVLAHALLAIGGYALVRQLGAGRTGAVVGAVAFAYAPWRLAQEGHLDIVSAGGIPLALALLVRGHGYSLRYGFRPGRRHAGWAVAGWLVATWQLSLGFSLGLPFAYALALLVVVVGVTVLVRRLRRRAAGAVLGWRLLVTDLLGVLIFTGVGALLALPYLRVPDTAPAGTEIGFFSAPLRGLLIGPAESRIWGAAHDVPRRSLGWPAEMTLLPGFVLYALALVGLVFSIWRLWHRLLLLVAVVVAAIFTLGTTFFDGRWTYLPLYGHLPSSFGVRIPGRLMLWVTLLLAVLAAGAVAEFVRRAEHLAAHRMPPWPGPWLRLATFVPLLLVLVETWNATAHPVVPDQPAAMRTVTGPTLVLPTTALTDQTVMLWSTSRFQPIANGSGGFAPQRQAELRRAVTAFPDAASVQYLRDLGIGRVLLLRAQVVGTPWERAGDVPVDTLGIRREDLDVNSVVFYLS